MNATVSGLHHVTAIAGGPQRNLDFYTTVLGLRLVKLTVNFDDPGSYHFYFGDATGAPGTILTFFPWPGAARGRQGSGQATTISFAIPEGSEAFWRERLESNSIHLVQSDSVFDEKAISFRDPDGLSLALVPTNVVPGVGWAGQPVTPNHAITGFRGVALELEFAQPTIDLLQKTLGYSAIDEDAAHVRLQTRAQGVASIIDVVRKKPGLGGIPGVGTNHHIAFRASSDEEQLEWQKEIVSLGLHVSPVMDRTYFHSIYFREPGGILFEIATDSPGFATDEAPEELGKHLMLPPQFESSRANIEKTLTKLELPK